MGIRRKATFLLRVSFLEDSLQVNVANQHLGNGGQRSCQSNSDGSND